MPRAAQLVPVVCGLLALPAVAADPDPWLRMKSANFELFTTAGERGGRNLIRHFEQVRSFFAQAFKLQGSPVRPAQVIAFRSEKEYEPYRPNEVASAFFQGGVDHDFIVMQSVSSDHYPTAVHEYTHLLVRQAELEIPPWLNEGLAELYSNLQPQGAKVMVGKVIPGRAHTLNTERWIPLRDLVAADHDSPFYNRKSHAGMFYAESWLLVHMLQMNPAYSAKFAALTGELKHTGSVAAFEKVYGRPIQKIDEDLKDYMRSPTMNARLFPVELPKSVDAPEIEALAGLAARLALAEMQWGSMEGRAKGRAAQEALVREFPLRWEAAAGLARMLMRSREYDESAKHFARAQELGSKDAKMYLDYGKLLTYSNLFQEALAPFRTAIEIDPASTEAHVELGVALTRTNGFREAIQEFQKTKSITPAMAPRYFYHFAYACYRMEALDEAKALLAKGRPHVKNPSERDSFDRLAESIATPRTAARVATRAVDRPELRRRAAEPDVQAPPQDSLASPLEARALPHVEGTLELVECDGQRAKLHVKVDGATKVLVITDPDRVEIRGAGGATVEFKCGKQTPRPVRVSFEGAGEVRRIEFQ